MSSRRTPARPATPRGVRARRPGGVVRQNVDDPRPAPSRPDVDHRGTARPDLPLDRPAERRRGPPPARAGRTTIDNNIGAARPWASTRRRRPRGGDRQAHRFAAVFHSQDADPVEDPLGPHLRHRAAGQPEPADAGVVGANAVTASAIRNADLVDVGFVRAQTDEVRPREQPAGALEPLRHHHRPVRCTPAMSPPRRCSSTGPGGGRRHDDDRRHGGAGAGTTATATVAGDGVPTAGGPAFRHATSPPSGTPGAGWIRFRTARRTPTTRPSWWHHQRRVPLHRLPVRPTVRAPRRPRPWAKVTPRSSPTAASSTPAGPAPPAPTSGTSPTRPRASRSC